MNRPTVIGSPTTVTFQGATPAAPLVPVNQFDYGKIVLKEAQLPEAAKRVEALDFATIRETDIVLIGHSSEQNLGRTLDGHLARLNKADAPATFALFDELKKGVDDAKLPEIVEKVKNPPAPGMIAKVMGFFRGKTPGKVMEEAFMEVKNLITGRTKTLADIMAKMERELQGRMSKLGAELQEQHRLQLSYITHFDEFALDAAVSRAFCEKARPIVEAEEIRVASLNPPDPQAQARVQEWRTKLGLLESRALALEGVYTRLPADQLVIQQIKQAGIATLQETATTMVQRLSSIKMTLLTLHAAFEIHGVQMLNQRQAEMDRQLTQVRGDVMKTIGTTAAAMPGQNRLAQAQQIETIITQLNEINTLVAAAREKSSTQMEEARTRFGNARQEIARLSSGN